jgi:hypothetical protein
MSCLQDGEIPSKSEFQASCKRHHCQLIDNNAGYTGRDENVQVSGSFCEEEGTRMNCQFLAGAQCDLFIQHDFVEIQSARMTTHFFMYRYSGSFSGSD